MTTRLMRLGYCLRPLGMGQGVSLSDEVDELGVLAPNSEALLERKKDLCNLLVSLEATSLRYGKKIASGTYHRT
jgi:hypothetical protein